MFTVKIERDRNDMSAEKAMVFWIHVWLHICSDTLDENIGSLLLLLMISQICAGLQNIKSALIVSLEADQASKMSYN